MRFFFHVLSSVRRGPRLLVASMPESTIHARKEETMGMTAATMEKQWIRGEALPRARGHGGDRPGRRRFHFSNCELDLTILHLYCLVDFCFRFVILQVLDQSSWPALQQSLLGRRDLDLGCSGSTCYGRARSWSTAAMVRLAPVAEALGRGGQVCGEQDLYRGPLQPVNAMSCAAAAGPRRHQRRRARDHGRAATGSAVPRRHRRWCARGAGGGHDAWRNAEGAGAPRQSSWAPRWIRKKRKW